MVWAGAQGVQVWRDARGLLKLVNGHIRRVFVEVEEPFDACSFKNVPSAVLLVPQVIPALDGVGNSPPFRWAQDDQAHLGLEVGLIKAGEDSEAVERLELRVEVLLLVRVVNESVQSDAVLVVGRQVSQLDSVPALGQVGNLERDHLVLVGLWAHWHRSVVDLKIGDGQGLEVDEEVGVFRGHSPDVEVDDSVTQVVVALL